MFTDVVGYSRMMGDNELLTVERIKSHHRLVRQLLQAVAGKEQDSAGDGFLLLFDSALEALQFAVALQQTQRTENEKTPQLPPLMVRIGIHLGDILVDGDAVYGEGLNLAARVEPLAEPGGICITHEVYSQVRHKVDLPIQSIGHRELKNIAHAPELFRVELSKPSPTTTRGRPWLLLSLLAVAAIVALCWLLAFLDDGAGHQSANAGTADQTNSAKTSTAKQLARLKGPEPSGYSDGVMKLAYSDQLGTFDPYAIIGKSSRGILNYIIERFGRFRQGRVVLGPIEKITISPSGKRIELWPKEGVVFHKHPCFAKVVSRNVSPGDVVFSVGQMAKSGLLQLPIKGVYDFRRGATRTLSGVYVGKANQVVIELDRALPYVREFLAAVPLLPKALEGCENLRDLEQPVGTGPFRWHQRDTEGVMLKRFAEYWGKDGKGQRLPYLQGMEWRYMPDSGAAISALGRGDLHLVDLSWKDRVRYLRDPNSNNPRLKAEFDGLHAEPIVGSSPRVVNMLSLLPLYNEQNPLRALKLRQAIHVGTDRDALTRTMAQKVLPQARFLRPRMHGYNPSIGPVAFDRQKALRLLAEAGFPNGRGLRPLRLASASDLQKTYQTWIAQMAALGIRVESVDLSVTGVEEAIKNQTVDAFWGRFSGMLMGHDPYYLFLTAAEVLRKFGYQGSTLLEAADRLGEKRQLEERKPLYARAEQLFLKSLPLIPFFTYAPDSPRTILLISKRVKELYDPLTNRLIDDSLRVERAHLAE